jgi:hypothetical protein
VTTWSAAGRCGRGWPQSSPAQRYRSRVPPGYAKALERNQEWASNGYAGHSVALRLPNGLIASMSMSTST